MTAERALRQRLLRAALVVQAVGALAVIGFSVPDFINSLRPLVCPDWCIDLRGVAFKILLLTVAPVIVVLVLLAWRWRGRRLWPLAIVAVIDAGALFVTAGTPYSQPAESIAPVASIPLLLLLPAIATLTLGANLVRPLPWKPILAVSAGACLLFTLLLLPSALRPA